MNTFLRYGILFAANSRLESLGSGFRGRHARIETEHVIAGAIVVCGIVLGLWLLSYIMSFQEDRRGYSSPKRLFISLCRAHGLRWSQWWFLWRVARRQRLRDPARLFLEPERLDPGRLGASLRNRAKDLLRLRQKLFADLDDDLNELPE